MKWQEALRRETYGDDHVSVNVEIWSGCDEMLRASACLSSEGQGRGCPENGNRAGERTGRVPCVPCVSRHPAPPGVFLSVFRLSLPER